MKSIVVLLTVYLRTAVAVFKSFDLDSPTWMTGVTVDPFDPDIFIVSGYAYMPFFNMTPVGMSDTFVVRFHSNGTVIWSTLFGGSAVDEPTFKHAVDMQTGDIFISSKTDSYFDYAQDPVPGFNLPRIFATRISAKNGTRLWTKIVGGINIHKVKRQLLAGQTLISVADVFGNGTFEGQPWEASTVPGQSRQILVQFHISNGSVKSFSGPLGPFTLDIRDITIDNPGNILYTIGDISVYISSMRSGITMYLHKIYLSNYTMVQIYQSSYPSTINAWGRAIVFHPNGAWLYVPVIVDYDQYWDLLMTKWDTEGNLIASTPVRTNFDPWTIVLYSMIYDPYSNQIRLGGFGESSYFAQFPEPFVPGSNYIMTVHSFYQDTSISSVAVWNNSGGNSVMDLAVSLNWGVCTVGTRANRQAFLLDAMGKYNTCEYDETYAC